MVIKIRRMVHRDKPQVMKVLNSIHEFMPSEVAVAEEVIDDYLAKSGDYIINVAEIGITLVGYICYGRTPLTESTWDIYWMAVLPDKQNQGIGRSLLSSAEKEIGRAGARLIIIETSSKAEYEKTRRFHLHRGYCEICRIPDFYASGDDKLILIKRLGK